MPAVPPALSDRFSELKLLSQGSLGDTWQARMPESGRKVVVKIRRGGMAQPGALTQRMLSLGGFDQPHPHLQRMLTLVEVGPDMALIAEFVPGQSLRDCLSAGPVDSWQMLQVTADVLSGLETLHRARLIHRDISPDNIILSPERGAVLIDFDALGDLTMDSSIGKTTVVGQFAGKPLYMAREQLAGAPQTTAVDLWALGAVLFEAVSGRPLRRATTFADLLTEAFAPDPLPLSEVPEMLRALLARMLAADPAARPDAAGAARMVAEILASRPAPAPGTIPRQQSRLPHPPAADEIGDYGSLLEAEFGAGRQPVPAPSMHSPPGAPGVQAGTPGTAPLAAAPAGPWLARRGSLLFLAGLALVAAVISGVVILGVPQSFQQALPDPPDRMPDGGEGILPLPPGSSGGPLVDVPYGPMGLLLGGVLLIALGALAARGLRGRASALETALPFDAARAISAPDGRARLSQTIVAEIGAFRDRAGSRANDMLSITMVALAREYAEAENADERLKALSMLTDLHARVARQFRPWWLDYEAIVARGLSLTSLVAGATAAIAGLRQLF